MLSEEIGQRDPVFHEVLLQLGENGLVLGAGEGQTRPGLAGPACSTRAMHVGFEVRGAVVVDHRADVVHV